LSSLPQPIAQKKKKNKRKLMKKYETTVETNGTVLFTTSDDLCTATWEKGQILVGGTDKIHLPPVRSRHIFYEQPYAIYDRAGG
jgi:hypothetical protein